MKFKPIHHFKATTVFQAHISLKTYTTCAHHHIRELSWLKQNLQLWRTNDQMTVTAMRCHSTVWQVEMIWTARDDEICFDDLHGNDSLHSSNELSQQQYLHWHKYTDDQRTPQIPCNTMDRINANIQKSNNILLILATMQHLNYTNFWEFNKYSSVSKKFNHCQALLYVCT